MCHRDQTKQQPQVRRAGQTRQASARRSLRSAGSKEPGLERNANPQEPGTRHSAAKLPGEANADPEHRAGRGLHACGHLPGLPHRSPLALPAPLLRPSPEKGPSPPLSLSKSGPGSWENPWEAPEKQTRPLQGLNTHGASKAEGGLRPAAHEPAADERAAA